MYSGGMTENLETQLAAIDAQIAAALERRRPTITGGRVDWRKAEAADNRLRSLMERREKLLQAARPVPQRTAKGVTAELAATATHVNAGGVWKRIVRHNPKSVAIVWGEGPGAERETIPLSKLRAEDLRTA